MELIPVEPHRRRRLRLWIYGALALIVVALAVGSFLLGRPGRRLGDVSWYETDFEKHPDVELLQEYVRIDTTPDTGSELAGAEFLAARLAEAGIDATVERLGERQANLWAIVEGDDPRALVLHNHIDVYPIRDPQEWKSPPFSATVEGPWIYGRGVFDMKSVAIAQLQAIRALAERGRPKRSVIFLATGSEEVGSELGTRWILERQPELRQRFWAVLTEGGVVEPVTRSEIKYWGIETAQRRYAEGWVCAADRERLERLRRDILEWGETVAHWTLVPEVESFLTAYAPSRTREEFQRNLGATWAAVHDPAIFAQLPPFLQSMFRSEAVPFEPEDDPEGGYRMRLLLHLLPGEAYDEARRRLLPEWLIHGATTVLRPPLGASTGSPHDHPAFLAVTEAVRREFPETRVGAYFQPWSATDARFFREAGIPAYGFSPFVIFNIDTFRVDASNERMGLPGFLDGVELYRRVVARIAG